MKTFFITMFLCASFLILSACSGKKAVSITSPTAVPTALATSLSAEATATPVVQTSTPTSAAAPGTQATPTAAPAENSAQATPTSEPGTGSITEQPTATPEQPTAAPTTAPTAQNCTNLAAFYGDLNIPDGTSFRAGDKFTKSWRFRNAGDCTWTPEYQVVFHSGEIMNAPLSIAFPGTVAPGEVADVSVDLEAPTRGGSFTGNWEFADPTGKRFGTGKPATTPFWVTINVSFMDAQGVALPSGDTGGTSSGGGSSGSAAVPAGCTATENQGYESQVIALINQARQQNGLDPLQENSQLDAAAAVHAADMACNNYMNHTGSDGSTWYNRIKVQGYTFSNALENIYAGPPQYGGDPQGAFNWWMNSQVHRDNILNPQMTEIGVGYFANPQSDFTGYYTVNFALP